MTNQDRRVYADIFHAFQIVGPDQIRFNGRVTSHDPGLSLSFLQTEIYRGFYAFARDASPSMPPIAFLEQLRLMNLGQLSPNEVATKLPHSFMALGVAPPSGGAWLRLYWNVGCQGALALVREATSRLSAASVPYRLKVMLDTSMRRRDAAVLYVPTPSWRLLAQHFDAVYDAVSAELDIEPDVPLFSRCVRPGIGLAEDPGGRHSFGTHRAWLVTFAVAESYNRQVADEASRWDVLRLCFDYAGLSLDRPYLNHLGQDPYCF